MSDCSAAPTPLPTNWKRDDSEGALLDEEHTKIYQSLVGSLMYAMCGTRPDLAFALSELSSFVKAPTTKHYKAAKRVLRYLKGTGHIGLKFYRTPKDTFMLYGYCDASWASETDSKSITGWIFKFGSGAISWMSKKQPIVALSTAEAEYVALSSATQEAVWIRRALNELGIDVSAPTPIYQDNQATIKIASNDMVLPRTKHIALRFHYVRDQVKSQEVAPIYCSTDTMIADVLTKPLQREKFTRFARAMIEDSCLLSVSGRIEIPEKSVHACADRDPQIDPLLDYSREKNPEFPSACFLARGSASSSSW
jgi:hypothetical protein